MHALEEHVALLEARLRQSHPSLALDHLSPVLRRASLLSALPMDNDTDGPAAHHETVDFHGEDADVLDFGDSDQSETMQEVMGGTLMSTNFGLDDLADDPMQGLVDPALDSTPTQNVFITDSNEEEVDIPGALIERPGIMSSMLSNRHLSISVGSSYASEYFRNAHPMWPFLHQQQWDDCWQRWESPIGYNTGAAWMDFFADMVSVVSSWLPNLCFNS